MFPAITASVFPAERPLTGRMLPTLSFTRRIAPSAAVSTGSGS